jgi:hypothetical protein
VVKKFGPEWRDKAIVPIVKALFDAVDYMMRKTAITAILELGIVSECADLLKKAAEDPVPNVRLVLARDLPRSEASVLAILQKDPDPDVAFFASRT